MKDFLFFFFLARKEMPECLSFFPHRRFRFMHLPPSLSFFLTIQEVRRIIPLPQTPAPATPLLDASFRFFLILDVLSQRDERRLPLFARAATRSAPVSDQALPFAFECVVCLFLQKHPTCAF